MPETAVFEEAMMQETAVEEALFGSESAALPGTSRSQILVNQQIRRCQNTLVIIGMGIIAFGFWSILKSVVVILMGSREDFYQSYGLTDDGLSDLANYISVGIVLAVDLWIRVNIGLKARREGLADPYAAPRRKQKSGYLVAAVFLIILSILSMIVFITLPFISNLIGTELETDMDLVSWIIELTNLIALIELVAAAFRLRRLKKQIRPGTAAAQGGK